MKSLQQRLQSRISLRRNVIAYWEREALEAKAILKDTEIPSNIKPPIKLYLAGAKSNISIMAHDQKTDKELYVLVLDEEAERRYYTSI